MLTTVKAEQLRPTREPKNSFQKLMLFPLSRIVLALLFVFPVIMLQNLISIYFLDGLQGPLTDIILACKAILLIALLIFVYRFYTKYVEKRTAHEFSLRLGLKEFGLGILIGGGMVIFITVVLSIFGAYKIEEINSPLILVNRIIRYSQGSFIEELIFTVILFKLIEDYSGTWVSYILVCLVFGGMHLMNDNATISSSLFISIMQITLLAPFILTRRIWMGWAVHLSWNFFQAGVFGMNNSGMSHGGFITPTLSGPDWLTGGAFGIEGSYLGLIVNLAVGVPIMIWAIKSNQIVKFPKRKEDAST